jgi:alpha-galactosidase
MRFLLVPIFVVAFAAGAGAPLDGIWVMHSPASGGQFTDTYFTLHQQDATLTGKMIFAWGDVAIRDGKIENGHLSFAVQFGDDAARRTVWDGVLEGADLHLTSITSGRKPVSVVAKAAPANALTPPAKLPLPALKDLPSNNLSHIPPMGWNSWNKFAGSIDDKTIRETADAMARSGMVNAGYRFINIDDTWEGQRDAQGRIHANSKFPDMKALADYVHGKHLLLGIYSSPGPKTCGGYEGSYGHEEQDAQTYDEWGVDYLKYDWCSAHTIYSDDEMQAVYQKMGEELRKVARPIVFSLCQYGRADVWKWGPKVGGNLWRTTDDIRDNYASMSAIGFAQNDLAPYAGPGHWNDPDMLEVGNGGMTTEEYRSHFSLWAELAAPLLAGNDISNMSTDTRSILLNKDVIAVDQDPMGIQGHRVKKTGDLEVWSKQLADGGRAVILLNRSAATAKVSASWSDIGYPGTLQASVRDLWAAKDLGKLSGSYAADVPSHGVVMLRVTP